ncbi:hypothetical protein DSECCO2_579760 [anaerobic digester metagenome]
MDPPAELVGELLLHPGHVLGGDPGVHGESVFGGSHAQRRLGLLHDDAEVFVSGLHEDRVPLLEIIELLGGLVQAGPQGGQLLLDLGHELLRGPGPGRGGHLAVTELQQGLLRFVRLGLVDEGGDEVAVVRYENLALGRDGLQSGGGVSADLAGEDLQRIVIAVELHAQRERLEVLQDRPLGLQLADAGGDLVLGLGGPGDLGLQLADGGDQFLVDLGGVHRTFHIDIVEAHVLLQGPQLEQLLGGLGRFGQGSTERETFLLRAEIDQVGCLELV